MTASATERAADYHADHGDQPTLSSSIARILVNRTPAHAWAAHPKLNPDYVPTFSDATDMGTAVHQLLLRDDRVDVADDYADFRTKEARAWRDISRAAGRVPMLRHQWDKANAVAERVREQILDLEVEPHPFTEGQAEHTIRFTANGAACRSMLDWLRNDHTYIDDLKTTGLTADPHVWGRKLFGMGYDIQAAFYSRAVEAEYGVTPGFRWVVVETKPPYPVSIVTLSSEAMDKARAKVDSAIQIWNECMASGEWPAYSRELHTADLPPWEKDLWAEVDPGEEVPF